MVGVAGGAQIDARRVCDAFVDLPARIHTLLAGHQHAAQGNKSQYNCMPVCLSLSQLVSACLSEVAVLSPAEAFLLTALPSAAAVQPWARTRVQKLKCVLPVGNWLC